MRYHAWLQWVAEEQWNAVRERARKHDVLLCGDEPFIIGQDSSDAWAHRDILRRDARLGVPPDDFSATGQDWGLPYFDFAAMEQDDYAWLKKRAAKAASYYDMRRVDHAVGYFRQWIRDEKTPTGRFIPDSRAGLEALRRAATSACCPRAPASSPRTWASSLPSCAPCSRTWACPATGCCAGSATTPSTATPTASPPRRSSPPAPTTPSPRPSGGRPPRDEERQGTARVYPEFQGVPVTREFTPDIHRATLASALNAGSDLCVLPWQDMLGTRDRINLPGSMGDANWSYRISQNVEDLLSDEQTRAAADRLGMLTAAARR